MIRPALVAAWLLSLGLGAFAQFASDVIRAMVATSTTRHVISPGEKTFTTQPGKAFFPGAFVMVISDDPAQPANYMYGRVVRYEGDQLTVAAKTLSGRGTHEDWTIQITGPPGLAGTSAGLPLVWSVDRSATDPGRGRVKVDDVPERARRLFISDYDTNHAFIGAVLATWDRSTSAIKGHLRFYVPFAPQFFLDYRITGPRQAAQNWSSFPIEFVAKGQRISIGDPVAAIFQPTGDKGDSATAASAAVVAAVTGAAVVVLMMAAFLLWRRIARH